MGRQITLASGYRVSLEGDAQGRSVTIERSTLRRTFLVPVGYRADHRVDRAFPDRIQIDERQIRIGDLRIDLETFAVSRGPTAWFEGHADLVQAARDTVMVERTSVFSRISVSVTRREGERIAEVTDERGKRRYQLHLDRGPCSAGDALMRIAFDGERLSIERRGMLPFVRSIDLPREFATLSSLPAAGG